MQVKEKVKAKAKQKSGGNGLSQLATAKLMGKVMRRKGQDANNSDSADQQKTLRGATADGVSGHFLSSGGLKNEGVVGVPSSRAAAPTLANEFDHFADDDLYYDEELHEKQLRRFNAFSSIGEGRGRADTDIHEAESMLLGKQLLRDIALKEMRQRLREKNDLLETHRSRIRVIFLKHF